MISPFTHAKQFPFSKKSIYYAAVLTLPAKKLFKNIEYQNMDQKDQMNILNDIVSKMSDYTKKGIKYTSFEYHPHRNNKKPCLHMNFLFEYDTCGTYTLTDHKYELVNFIDQIKRITGSTMIDKICYHGLIKTEIDVFNWVNYMFKDYDDHFEQLNDYKESLIEWAHIENYNERHKPLFNDLDYK